MTTYTLGIHKENIKKINNPVRLTKNQILRAIQIDPEHLKEKNNWYLVANVLSYFKARKDCRLLGEMLNKDIFEIFHKSTANYQIVRFGLGKTAEVEKIGLLSANIQKPDYEYYDVSNLHRLYPEMARKYGQYTIKKLLDVLNSNNVPGCQELTEEIITVYVLDWFCHQLDRNPKNLLFERSEEGKLSLATLIDNESSFGINSGKINVSYNRIWVPSIPYEDADFSQNPMDFAGCDYNIFGILMYYPEIVIPILKQLTDTNFSTMINKYRQQPTNAIYLPDGGIDFLSRFIEEKQEEGQKLLTL